MLMPGTSRGELWRRFRKLWWILMRFSVRKWETFFSAFRVHTSNVYMEVPLVLRPKRSLDVEKQTGRRIFRTSLREATGFELHVGPWLMSPRTKRSSDSQARDNHRMIPQCALCCLGSLGEKINMRHILYGQDKQLWFTYKHLLYVQCPGDVLPDLLNKKINLGGVNQNG